MIYLSKVVIFHSCVSLPEGTLEHREVFQWLTTWFARTTCFFSIEHAEYAYACQFHTADTVDVTMWFPYYVAGAVLKQRGALVSLGYQSGGSVGILDLSFLFAGPQQQLILDIWACRVPPTSNQWFILFFLLKGNFLGHPHFWTAIL